MDLLLSQNGDEFNRFFGHSPDVNFEKLTSFNPHGTLERGLRTRATAREGLRPGAARLRCRAGHDVRRPRCKPTDHTYHHANATRRDNRDKTVATAHDRRACSLRANAGRGGGLANQAERRVTSTDSVILQHSRFLCRRTAIFHPPILRQLNIKLTRSTLINHKTMLRTSINHE